MKSRKTRAFTLIELMITLAIVIVVLSLGLITLRGYLPKQRLISSASEIENLLNRAQAEANARSYWTCIKFAKPDGILTASLFSDKDGNHGSIDACGAGDDQIQNQQLKKGVDLAIASHAGCSENVQEDCILWFDSTGMPKKCANSGECGGTAPLSGCVDASYQIVISSADMDATTRAREIEALSGGLIQTVKPGDVGLDNTVYAMGVTPETDDGCE